MGLAGEQDDLRSCSGEDDFEVDGDASKRDFFTLRSNGVSSLVWRLTDPSDLDVDELVFSSIELTGDRSVALGWVGPVAFELGLAVGNAWEKNGESEALRKGFMLVRRGR